MKTRKRGMKWKKSFAAILSVSMAMGSLSGVYALGEGQDPDNKNTILLYEETDVGLRLKEFIPNEDATYQWESGLREFESKIKQEGFSNISEAFDENDMIYVSKGSGIGNDIPLYIEGGNEIPKGIEPYDGQGGEYYLWRWCKASTDLDSQSYETVETEEETTNSESTETSNIVESAEHFWVRSADKVSLEENVEEAETTESDVTKEKDDSEESPVLDEADSSRENDKTENEATPIINEMEEVTPQNAENTTVSSDGIVTVTTYKDLKATIEGASSDLTIAVNGAMNMAGKITIPTGRKITLTGGGTINRVSGQLSNIFYLSGKGTALTLNDITLEGNNVATSEAGILVEKDAELYINDGALIRRFNRGAVMDGSCIRLDYGGRCYMSGGILEENRGAWGTAINARYNAYFEMTGGTIWHNISSTEAAVDMYDGIGGSYVITGGEIKENYTQYPYYTAGIINGREATTYKGSTYSGTFTLDELHQILNDGELNGGKLLQNYSFVGGDAKIYDNYVGTGINFIDYNKTWEDHKKVIESSAKRRETSIQYFSGSYGGRDVIAPLNDTAELHFSEGYPNVDRTSSGISTSNLGQDLKSYNFARIVNEEGKRDLRGLKSDVYVKNKAQIIASRNDYRGAGEYTSWIPAADGFLYWVSSDTLGKMFNITKVRLVDQNGRDLPYTGGAAITTTTQASNAPDASNNAYAVNENTIAYENGVWEANTVSEKTFYAPDLSAEGFSFSGEYCIDSKTKVSGNAYNVSDYKSTHELVFYYNANYYDVKYDGNGGSLDREQDSVRIGEAITLPEAVREGHTFDGWYTEKEGGEKVGDAATSYTPQGSVTLYARWTANQHGIKYILNKPQDESVTTEVSAPEDDTAEYGSEYTVKAPTAEKLQGIEKTYVFLGWDDGNGKLYKPNEKIEKILGDVTLTGSWSNQANTYMFTYDINMPGDISGEAVTAPADKELSHGDKYVIEGPDKTQLSAEDKRYVFGGWKDEAGNVYQVDQEISVTTGLKLTALWITKFTVSYELNGGTGGIPIPGFYEEGENVTVGKADNLKPPVGKLFTNWESSIPVSVNGAETTNLQPGDVFLMPARSVVIIPVWNEEQADITFDGFESGNALIKVKNQAGKVSTKELPKVKINGVDATAEQMSKMSYSYERYVRTKKAGVYSYGWSEVFKEGEQDAEISKLPVSITKPGKDDSVISASTKITQSGIVRLTVTYNGNEEKQASCIIISSGDIDIDQAIRAQDIEMLDRYLNNDETIDLKAYEYQRIMADMNSEQTTGNIGISYQDLRILEEIILD